MKIRALLAVLMVIAVALLGVTTILGSEDSPVKQYSDKEFDRYDRGEKTTFFHQRMIGEAIVEGDFLSYCFNTASEELISNFSSWRKNLTEELPRNLTTEAEALEIAGGGEYVELYYLSPDSMIYRPAPETPVWVVWHAHEPDRWGNVTVIDAVTGDFIASGIPPISTIPRPTPELPESKVGGGELVEAFIFTGPMYADPCSFGWPEFVDTVELYLVEMGYEIYRPADYPDASAIEQYISNNEIAIFYEHCHGGVDYFWSGCDDMTYDEEVEAWMENYPKIPFVFLANCNGMCGTGTGTLIDAFTKGSDSCVVVVGYCGMSHPRCRNCTKWRWSWEEMFFSALADGDTVEEAYNKSADVYSSCEDCILCYGDSDLRLVPKVTRCAAGLDIGSPSIDRDFSDHAGWTYILKENPADASGTINFVTIYAPSDMSYCKVGTFYETEELGWKCRSAAEIGDVPGDSQRTFSVSLTVEAGDYLGIFFGGGAIDSSGEGAGVWWNRYDKCWVAANPDAWGFDVEFQGYHTISLYGSSCKSPTFTPTGYITGEVRDVNGCLLTNITIQLYKKDFGLVATTNTGSGSNYTFAVNETGEYWLVASG